MELPNTSSIRFLNLAGDSIDTPIEWTHAYIILPVDDIKQDMSLHCQPLGNMPLYAKFIRGQRWVIADWPRVNTGHYHLTLQLDGRLLTDLTVTVQPKKISMDAYNYMLEDLDERLPASIALGLQRTGALAKINLLPPGQSTLAQELIRLRRAIRGSSERPGLIYVFKNLLLAPYEIHQIFKTSEEWVPRTRARRPHPSRLVQAMARPGNVDATKLPLNVLDTRVEHSFDTYENQLLKYYTFQIASHLHRLIDNLTKKSQKNEAQKNTLIEAQSLQEELTAMLQQAIFLRDVSQAIYLSTQITMVFLKHPLYRLILEGFLEFQQSPTVRLDEQALEAPLENLPRLYQVWATLHVLEALLSTANELGYKVEEEHLARKEKHDLFIQLIPNGKPIIKLVHPEHGTTVLLTPEKTYKKHGLLYSTTHEQRPDIVIEVHPPISHTRIYLFDPKYKLESQKAIDSEKTSKPKKEDIDKMHVYHDAIRDQAGNHIVAYAAILYPGKEDDKDQVHQYQTEDIEALQAYPNSVLVEPLGQRLRSVFFKALQYQASVDA